MKKSLPERMERAKAPKTWIAEVTKLQQTIDTKNELLKEYGDIIDVLARKVEVIESE